MFEFVIGNICVFNDIVSNGREIVFQVFKSQTLATTSSVSLALSIYEYILFCEHSHENSIHLYQFTKKLFFTFANGDDYVSYMYTRGIRSQLSFENLQGEDD